MNTNQKIKAFTLIDLMTTIVITSIIIGATYYFFTFLQKGKLSFEQKSSLAFEINKVHNTINYLFNQSDSIKSSNYEIQFFEGNRLSTLDFDDSTIVFYDGVENKISTEKLDWEVVLTEESKLVKKLKIHFWGDELEFEWYFSKNYGVLLH